MVSGGFTRLYYGKRAVRPNTFHTGSWFSSFDYFYAVGCSLVLNKGIFQSPNCVHSRLRADLPVHVRVHQPKKTEKGKKKTLPPSPQEPLQYPLIS